MGRARAEIIQKKDDRRWTRARWYRLLVVISFLVYFEVGAIGFSDMMGVG